MNDLVTVAVVIYVLVGLLVYFLTDTTQAASRIERLTPLPWGLVQEYLFFFVVALWPVWLWLVSGGRTNGRG